MGSLGHTGALPAMAEKYLGGDVYESPTLTTFVKQLWDSDVNRLTPGKDFILNPQGRTKYALNGPDEAKGPLFARVDEGRLKRPSYHTFLALLDNYEAEMGVPETMTQQKFKDTWVFIHTIFQTKPMQLAYLWLKHMGKARDQQSFKRELYDMWFKPHSSIQGQGPDTSCFEHTFVGEIRGTAVLGFDSWLQMYSQEKAGQLNYKGHFGSTYNPHSHWLSVQFSWKGATQPGVSMLMGPSPEFELALFTVGHVLGQSTYNISLGGEAVVMKCDSERFARCNIRPAHKRYRN